ncbi:MAG: hypothetical protein P8R42_16105 [Candidatus Binatia bacterium]|nr:hypothetical protein [Candidatus Binatia bacterium]
MSEAWTADKMLDLGTRHARLEHEQDLEGVMSTLVPDPVYEFHPIGLCMRGESLVRRYYEELFRGFVSAARNTELVDEWVNRSSVAQEYRVELEIDGTLESHRIVGVLFRQGDLLGGERVYASERCIRLMTGSVFDALNPMS